MIPRNRPREWVVGLVIALALMGLAIIFAESLGIGDDPSFQEGARLLIAV